MLFTCGKCGGQHDRTRNVARKDGSVHRKRHPYCLACHAKYMRETRPKYADLPLETKLRSKARNYARVYLTRGKLAKQGCEVCGTDAQMHHDDYSKPLTVRWFCREHHLELHATLLLASA